MMLEPSPRCGRAALHSQNMAYRLVFSTRSNCSLVTSASPPA